VTVTRIISGGQTGVDRAGLDVARSLGIQRGGYCPRGRVAEDGAVPAEYKLEELSTLDYPSRTRANVQAADRTAIFAITPKLQLGSLLTWRTCFQLEKPRIHLWRGPGEDGEQQCSTEEAAALLTSWLAVNRITTLNVAGTRASREPEAYSWAEAVLLLALAGREMKG
jgi:Circularly permutated YpsA SLOG family